MWQVQDQDPQISLIHLVLFYLLKFEECLYPLIALVHLALKAILGLEHLYLWSELFMIKGKVVWVRPMFSR